MDFLSTYITNFYWIDTIFIFCITAAFYVLIQKKSIKILTNNMAYNKELRAMRTEIYTEYERNFFL